MASEASAAVHPSVHLMGGLFLLGLTRKSGSRLPGTSHENRSHALQGGGDDLTGRLGVPKEVSLKRKQEGGRMRSPCSRFCTSFSPAGSADFQAPPQPALSCSPSPLLPCPVSLQTAPAAPAAHLSAGYQPVSGPQYPALCQQIG